MTQCIDLIKANDIPQIVEWLAEDSSSRWENFAATLRSNVTHSKDVATFVCENARFLASGRIGKLSRIFDDESLNVVASGLGRGALYGPAHYPDLRADEQIEINNYSFDDFVDILKIACGKVETPVAFAAVVESLSHRPSETDKLLVLLGEIIKKSSDRAPRITTTIGMLSQILERITYVTPLLRFLRDMWILDVQDAHNVSKMSLISLSLRMHTLIVNKKALFQEHDPGIEVANLLCCWKSDMFSWISCICIYSDKTTPCTLDSTSLDEALCCFRLLTDDQSVMPRVYSLPCLVSMHIKVAHVLALNTRDGHVDAHTSILLLLETAIDMLKRSCAEIEHSISLSDEFVVALLGCCSDTSKVENFMRILDFLINILTEDTRITLFGRVSSGCDTDSSLTLCLRLFRNHFPECDDCIQTRVISVLKRVSERLLSDVRVFCKTWECLLSWLESLGSSVDDGSSAYKLLLDLYNSLRTLTTEDRLDLRLRERVLNLLDRHGQRPPNTTWVVMACDQISETSGATVQQLSSASGLEPFSEGDHVNERYLMAVAVTRCILIQREKSGTLTHRPDVSERFKGDNSTAQQIKELSRHLKPSLLGNYKPNFNTRGAPLSISVRNPELFLQSPLFLNICQFVGTDVMIDILRSHRMFVPSCIFKMCGNAEYAWMLQEPMGAEESKVLFNFMKSLIGRMDAPQSRIGGHRLRPFVFIQCTGTIMYNKNFWNTKTRRSWSDITLSRHSILYRDTFSRKFGFRPSDLLGAIISSCNGSAPGKDIHSTAQNCANDAKTRAYGALESILSRTPGIMVSSNVIPSYTLGNKPTNGKPSDDARIWKVLMFVLFDHGFVDRRFRERQKAVKSFIEDFGKTTGKKVRRKSLMLGGIFRYFKIFLQNVAQYDICREYWSRFGRISVYNAEHEISIDPELIVQFIHNIVDGVVPQDLLGCSSNYLRFKDICRTLIVLNKGEKLDMSQVMHGFKAVKCPWNPGNNGRLANGQTHTILTYISRLAFFLLEHMVIPLLQRHFYVTEANYAMYRLLYFSKAKWHRMVMKANDAYISDVHSFNHIDAKGRGTNYPNVTTSTPVKDISHCHLKTQSGILRVRWIPKHSGMRPILNCNYGNFKRSSNGVYTSLNDVMRIPFQALRAQIRMNPRLLGNGILGYPSAFRSIKRWWVRFKHVIRTCNTKGDCLTLYVTLADLSRCYERINHAYLLKALSGIDMRGLLLFHKIHRRELIRVASSSNSYSRCLTLLSNDSSSVFSLQKSSLMTRSFGQVCICSRYANNNVLHKASGADVIRAVKVLLSHVGTSLPKSSPNQVIRNDIGIPQGCCISPLLCSLYLAQGDFNVNVRRLTDSSNGNLLLRWIDDFIFISKSEDDNREMMRILRDTSAFGLAINDKLFTMRLNIPLSRNTTGVTSNFGKSDSGVWTSRLCIPNKLDDDCKSSVPAANQIPSDGNALLSWINCTFDFDFVRGCLNATLTPWKNLTCDVRDSLNLSRNRFATFMFSFIEQRLLGYISNRLRHGLFTSTELNTPLCVMQNSYVVMRICTMKLVSAISALCTHFGGFINVKYIGRLAHKLVDHTVMLVSLGGADIRKSRLRDLLQLAVIFTLSPTWLSRLSRKFGRRRIKFVRSIEKKFKNQWPDAEK
ncbi:Telomerase reverse transcriptase [Babesia sp. Xinjiang]|uniref:Telomerase reverse transcriptase n=1 Tax=Babesia sp. Xinjiang TaxID=462227 RepID=UPI000A218FD9|nr:Telomerase reverse transcriptase [Babesia sp. Xinjiang]ORM41218.1 Telomerase reverse transcriptase [Babesia sp. Xinjiang]